MRKKIVLIFLLLCNTATADWSKWLESPEGDASFINTNKIKLVGDSLLFVVRKRLSTANDAGEQSIETQYEMNCHSRSYKILQVYFYEDKNWSKLKHSFDPKDKGRLIRPDTATEILAGIVCK